VKVLQCKSGRGERGGDDSFLALKLATKLIFYDNIVILTRATFDVVDGWWWWWWWFRYIDYNTFDVKVNRASDKVYAIQQLARPGVLREQFARMEKGLAVRHN